tara:strand:- start:351 stop:1208 length:858 start_codon:yes stop_codon:yes gene_type:complete
MIYFLEQILLLLSLTVIGNGGFYVFYYTILYKFNRNFRKLSHRRRLYDVKNITKATILSFLTFYLTPHVYDMITTGKWDNDIITYFGNVYVSTDLAGLLFVRDLPNLTKIHHTVVLCLGIFSICVDYGVSGIHRNLIALTYFSIIPYLVNCLLGTKDLRFPSVIYKWLAIISSIMYAICITINFLYQHITILFYSEDLLLVRIAALIIYHLIFMDDRNLMYWLFKVAKNPKFNKNIDNKEVEKDNDSDIDESISENESVLEDSDLDESELEESELEPIEKSCLIK